jgi:FkbM family methyltransferase
MDMIFISYAQNLEDVILWRMLGRFGPGFYIDVGANDPTSDSMTRGFYDLGWHGINVEPVREHLEDLKKARPRDVNLGIAVGNRPGEIELHESTVKGWSTASTEVAALHRAQGQFHRTVLVPMQTLATICEQHAPEAIHFLKIDVEGFEKEVLEGADFQRYRPWIIVIEATRPNSNVPSFAAWEPLLMKAGYIFGYFDGLNRFYVAREKSEFVGMMTVPPNVFDNFKLRPGHNFSFPVFPCEQVITELVLTNCRTWEERVRLALYRQA